MLKIEQLDVKERSGRYLLKDISMEIPAGHVIGLTVKAALEKQLCCGAFGDCFTQAVILMPGKFCWTI